MIVCIGEALVDMIPRTLPSGDESYLPISGGAVFNTSIALSRLGSKAALLTGLSTDLFGQQIRASMLQSGVDTDLVVASDRPTTLAFVKLIDGSAQYSFFDENSAMRMLTLSDLGAFPKSAKALFMGGISLAIEPFGVACKEYLGTLDDDVPVMVDPNIRPTFISDEKAYRERLQTIIARSDIIKVSDEDLELMEPGSNFEEIAKDWIEQGASLVLRTLGGDGAEAITATQAVKVNGVPVEVVDTVGAGDTFNAGLLHSLDTAGKLNRSSLKNLDDQDISTALSFACRCAAHTVGQAGANPPWQKDL